ncbi:MAG: hypothetical protein HOI95_22870, partial [Chromatiales bacterium]|nr:hypothetical protein [Chromatiales bacterium]
MSRHLTARRTLRHPIIVPDMDARMGDNICGPAILRVPPWVPNPLGRYYLYFADHKGDYIRLAVADELHGPWTMHTPGALDIEASLFDAQDPPEPPPSERPPWAQHMKGGYLYAHIASPDIHVDEGNERILMYYHGLLSNGAQATRLATSENGVDFVAKDPLLGPPYFRVFERGGYLYTVTWGGVLWRGAAWDQPFEEGQPLIHYAPKDGIGEGFRHGETFVADDTLFVLYTRMGDCPERIMYVSVDLNADWRTWSASEPQTLLTAERIWEGAALPKLVSTMGAERQSIHELRDPCVFR